MLRSVAAKLLRIPSGHFVGHEGLECPSGHKMIGTVLAEGITDRLMDLRMLR